MRLHKLALLFVPLLCALLFTSCMRLEFDAENLMDAPMLTSEQIEIREALYDGLRTRDVKFKYPKEGEYRSAFVMYDLDGNGEDEALVFYDPQIGENQTWVGVLTKRQGGGWVLNGGRSGKGSNIDSVAFCKMTSSDKINIVVGWSQGTASEKTIEVYSYNPDENDTLEQLSYANYDEMLLYDINKDGLTELLLLRCNTTQSDATAQLVAVGTNDELKSGALVGLDGNIIEFKRVQVGMLTPQTEAVFIDATLENGNTSTNILKYDFNVSNKMIDVLGNNPDDEPIMLERSQQIYCEDFDGDGIIEVPHEPTMSYLPGYSEEYEGKTISMLEYLRIEDGAFTEVWRGVANTEAGWRFEMPETWIDAVTVKVQPGTGEWRFLVYDITLDNSYQEILRISANNKSLPVDENASEV